MARKNKDSQRTGRRAFRPTVDGRLESRELLSAMPMVKTHVAHGGQASVVTLPTGEQFFVSVFNGGTVRTFPASGGRVNIVVDGSNAATMLEINQIFPDHSNKSGAHSVDPTLGVQYGILNVASIQVTDGSIGAIEGYRDAVLSGQLSVGGSGTVDRIAFKTIMPGASIGIGGTLNTLDIYDNADFSGSTGLFVAQDLNWMEVGANLTFENGAKFTVGRDLGLVPQIAKGSGHAGQGLFINGNFTIGTNSAVTIGRNIPFGVVVNGNLTGFSRLTVGGVPLTTYLFVVRPSQGLGDNFLLFGTATA